MNIFTIILDIYFELGYHLKYYKYLDKYGDLNKKINILNFMI